MATLTTGAPRLELGCGVEHDAQDTPDLEALMCQISAMMAPAESPEAARQTSDDYLHSYVPSNASTSSSSRPARYERSGSRKGAGVQRDIVDVTKRSDPFHDGDSKTDLGQSGAESLDYYSDGCSCDECVELIDGLSGGAMSGPSERRDTRRELACPNDGIQYPTAHSILPARGPPCDAKCLALDYLHRSLKEAGAVSRDPSPCRVGREAMGSRN